jgi:hypothetical protein
MPRQELAYQAEIDIREYMSAAREPATEVLDGLDILLDRDAAIAAALEVVDVAADNRRQGAALQSSLDMQPFEEILDHRRLPSARVRARSHEDYAQLVKSMVSTRALKRRHPRSRRARTLRITEHCA